MAEKARSSQAGKQPAAQDESNETADGASGDPALAAETAPVRPGREELERLRQTLHRKYH
jgi:hypothetical protein